MKAAIRLVAALTGLAAGSLSLMAQDDEVGRIYTTTNAAQNELIVFARSTSGHLKRFRHLSTGGAGTGVGLGSDNAIQISKDGRFLLTVNAGSNSIALFNIEGHAPDFITAATSGGNKPISLALAGDLVYVLNSGSPANVSGFRLHSDGWFEPIPGATQVLSTPAPVAPQIGYSDTGHVVVTEKATNKIDVFTVNFDGSLSTANVQASSGATPFGFLFDRFGRLIVTEAVGATPGGSTVSSYSLLNDGTLQLISASVPDFQTAACWIALSKSGEYVYTANTDSDNISTYRIARDGSLALIGSGVSGVVAKGSGPADLGLSDDGNYLYVLNAFLGTISGWGVREDGTLTPRIQTFGGLPLSTSGLAVK